MIQVFRHGNKITIFVIMKKRLSASIASSALIITTCMVCFSANHIHPDYFNANVEALSSASEGDWKYCYNTFVNDPAFQEVYCGTCATLPGRPSKKSICK